MTAGSARALARSLGPSQAAPTPRLSGRPQKAAHKVSVTQPGAGSEGRRKNPFCALKISIDGGKGGVKWGGWD